MLIIAYLQLCKQAHFCIILLIMWVGGLKNRGKCAYVIYVWSLRVLHYRQKIDMDEGLYEVKWVFSNEFFVM